MSIPFYGLKIYNEDKLVRDFKPCINKHGNVGVYDFVSNKFFELNGIENYKIKEKTKTECRGDKNMTIKDLYEWAIENKVEDFDIRIQYRDGGGYYYGSDSLYESDIDIDELRSEVIL